jgi:cell division septation protein DedD
MNQIGGSKMDMLVKLVLIIFISLLSFSVGTFVGKQFSDSQHKLAALEGEDSHDRETASVSPEATEVKPEDALSDEDIAQLTEEFVKSEKKADAGHDAGHDAGQGAKVAANDSHGAAAHDAHAADAHKANGSDHGHETGKVEKVVGTVTKDSHAAKAADSHGHEAKHAEAHGGHDAKVSDAAARVAKGEAPTAAVKPKEASRVPTSLPEQVSAQTAPKFFVQVASYAKEDEASKRAESLKGQGFSAYTVKVDAAGKTMYRVGIGAFATQDEATDGLKKVKAAPGLGDAFIQKIVK